MSSVVAPGGIIIAMGSPGTTRSRTNTTTATPNNVGNAQRRRFSRYVVDIAKAQRKQELGINNHIVTRPRLDQVLSNIGLHFPISFSFYKFASSRLCVEG